MKIATSSSVVQDTEKAITESYKDLEAQLGVPADLLFVSCSNLYDCEKLVGSLSKLAPNAKISGKTSCLGAMTETGYHSKEGYGLSLMGISDPEGGYGVGFEQITEAPQQDAVIAVQRAIEASGRAGELPSMVLISSAPGFEEQMIKGIEEVVGTGVPITGGSSADNTVEGNWKQMAQNKVYNNAVVVTVLFPSVEVTYAFHSGYAPTNFKGVVTKAEGRTLYSIDNRSAAEVYNEWTQGTISPALPEGGNVLSMTALHPLGRVVGKSGDLPYYELSHPNHVTEEGALTLFSNIQEGEDLTLMTGTKESLLSRAGSVAQSALDVESLSSADVSGAFVIYCAGCMLTVQDDMNEVVSGINKVLNNKPFLGSFTFGEQGCFIGGENRHGNLMISMVLFGKSN